MNATKRYNANKKREAISLLKYFSEKIKRGEVIVESSGWWQGTPGTYTLKVSVKEVENRTIISNL
jgi:hypothetical protein